MERYVGSYGHSTAYCIHNITQLNCGELQNSHHEHQKPVSLASRFSSSIGTPSLTLSYSTTHYTGYSFAQLFKILSNKIIHYFAYEPFC